VQQSDHEYPMIRLHQEVDRLFAEAFRSFGIPTRWTDWDPGAPGMVSGLGETRLLRPKVDICENDDAYQISVEVPGVKKSDLSVQLEGDCLIISGEKHQE